MSPVWRVVARQRGAARSCGLLVLLVGIGCAPTGPRPRADLSHLPAPTSVAEAFAPTAERIAGLTTVRAGLELRWEDPRTEERESCRGSLTFSAPDRLRLRGITGSFFTVFDLIVGERSVWLDVPREKMLGFGERADRGWEELPFSPARLFTALLAHPCPGEECVESASLESSGGRTRLRGQGWILELDPLTRLPARLERNEPRPLIITWSGWHRRAGSAWPTEIKVQTVEGAPSLQARFGRIKEGREVRDSIFYFQPDEDREILTPYEMSTRWKSLEH